MITNIILSLWNIQPHLWGSAFNCDRWIFKSSKTAMNKLINCPKQVFTLYFQLSVFRKVSLASSKIYSWLSATNFPWQVCAGSTPPLDSVLTALLAGKVFCQGGGFLFPSPVCISAITLCLRQCLSFSEISFQFCVQLQHLAWRLMWQLAPLFLSSYLQNSRPAVLFIRRV